MPTRAMLMAAGLGTRLRPFTELEPKALLPVMGIPCAQFAVDAATRAGVREIVANVHHLAARAREGLAQLELAGARLTVSDESGLLLGSAGGIAKALPSFQGEPFFLLNADVLCSVDLGALARQHARLRAQHGVRLTLAVFEKPEGSGAYREILMDREAGLIRGLVMEPTRGTPYFVGAAVIEPDALAGVRGDEPSEFIPKILMPAIESGRAGFFPTRGLWYDVGSPELWYETHIELMRRLETGDLPREWRTRIEAKNRRVSQGVWLSARFRTYLSAQWEAPAYFNDLGDSTARPPRDFGPRAILYGGAQPGRGKFENKISYRGVVCELKMKG